MLLVVKGGSIPAWIGAIELALLVFAGVIARQRGGRIAALGPVRQERAELEDMSATFDYALERYEVYSAHLAHVLDHLQRVISKDIEVSIPDYIQRGILEPGRDVLMEDPEEDIRLSVLLPESSKFVMAWAAGHDLQSQPNIAWTSTRHSRVSPSNLASSRRGTTWRRTIVSRRIHTPPVRSTPWFPSRYASEMRSLASSTRSHRGQVSSIPQNRATCCRSVVFSAWR